MGGGVPSGYLRCDSLRAAIDAANAKPEHDVIYLQAEGDYVVSQQLTLTDDVTIFGRGPRRTTVRGGGASRVFEVAAGITATFTRFGISGGRAGSAEGGNILNHGTLYVDSMRISDGRARGGGGIANIGPGILSVLNSLVRDNVTETFPGGGIYSRADEGDAAQLAIVNTTIAFNSALNADGPQGGGVATQGTSNAVLSNVTIARNAAGFGGTAGLYVGSQADTATLQGTIVAENRDPGGAHSNCGGAGNIQDLNESNREDNDTCRFEINGAPFLSEGLVDMGGYTEVLTISPESIAKGAVEQCPTNEDQRRAPRTFFGICDAGAFQEGAIAPAIDEDPEPEPLPIPQPPPPPPPPPPVPTVVPVPTPVAGQTVVARAVRGTVRVRRPGSREFVEIDAAAGIPVGSTVDTKRGTVEIAAVPRAGAGVERANFFDGIFRITQSRGITNLALTEQLAPCRRASAAQRKPKSRRLWGDGRGRFRISGRYSAATIRGTRWMVRDTCAGTLTRVTQGTVNVRYRGRTIIVRANRSFLARPRR
jgi:hypothetical protein